jgi:hypothetical protein
MVAKRPAHVASALKLCSKGVVIELKREIVEGKGGYEGEGGRPTTNLWLIGHAWPPLNTYFHPPFHLEVKQIPFVLFQSSFFLKFLDFILCNDEINMLWKRSK